MPRAFLVVMDSVGIGGAPDADTFFNAGQPDSGANTVAHIAQATGGLDLPALSQLGLGAAVRLASGEAAPGLADMPQRQWGAATPASAGKDTPTGHWELAGYVLPTPLHQFPQTDPAFSKDLRRLVCDLAGTDHTLGNCHASGTDIVDRLGSEHVRTGYPICYTSTDSVFQIAAHAESFGLSRLIALCEALAPKLHDMRVGRVIARPFQGDDARGYTRTGNRRDFALLPPQPMLCDWASQAGCYVQAIGKVGDIFSMRGIDHCVKGDDAALMTHLADAVADAPDRSLIFANFVEFDSLYGHRRDPIGYAAALQRFDAGIGRILPHLRRDDVMILTADHGNDPTWIGTDHTRERVPVLVAGAGQGSLGHVAFVDVAASVAQHLHLPETGPGISFLA